MKHACSTALLAALATLAGCGSIGEGSTVVSIEIRDSSGNPITGSIPISQCLRDQVIAVATFTDGTRADFSFRVQWSSSDPAVFEVSNGDIPTTFVDGNAFATLPGSNYRPGTLVPKAAAGSTATLTARFLNMSATSDVEITAPTLRIAPLVAGIDPGQAPPTSFLGPATSQRFGFYVEQSAGRFLVPTAQNTLGALNPVLWRFQDAGNTYVPRDPDDAADFNRFVVPDATTPHASITPTTGVVRAIVPDATVYTVQATTSLCEDAGGFTPTATIRVAPFAVTDPLVLQHEADINGPGVAPTGDLIAGTGEILRVIANLDTDGDPEGEETQDLSAQADIGITHTLACVAGTDTNCTCDSDGTNCTKRLLGVNGSLLFSLINNDSAEATVQACFTNVDTTHADDCEEEPDPDDATQFKLVSGTLDIHVIPVDLTGAGASLFIRPASAAEPAFTYPGQQFDAFGTFTALSGTPFDRNGTPSATATQKITRNVTWITRKQGSTTEFAEEGFVRNASDGYFGPQGSFHYLEDVAADTVVDIHIAPATPFSAVPAPATPVPFTLCPSAGCSP